MFVAFLSFIFLLTSLYGYSAFFKLLGTEIDASSSLTVNKATRNELLELIFNYLNIHFQFNAEKIKSHIVLKSIFH